MANYAVPRERLKTSRRVPAEDVWFVSSLAVISLVIFGTWIAALRGNDSQLLTYIQLSAWIALLADGIFGAIGIAMRQPVRRLRERWRREARYHTTDSTLSRSLPDEVDVSIRFDEIQNISETDEWLMVRASNGWLIQVPRDVAQYEELRMTLARYKAIAVSRPVRVTAIAGTFVIAGSLTLLILTHEHTTRVWSGATLVAALTWQYLFAPLLQFLRRSSRWRLSSGS